MKKTLTLLIICFFFFKSYALSDDDKAATVAGQAKVRKTNGNMIADPPFINSAANKDSFCEGRSTILTATGGDGRYQWYHNDVLMDNDTSNKRIVSKVGQYRVISINIKSNALNIVVTPTPSKPTLTYTE